MIYLLSVRSEITDKAIVKFSFSAMQTSSSNCNFCFPCQGLQMVPESNFNQKYLQTQIFL